MCNMFDFFRDVKQVRGIFRGFFFFFFLHLNEKF